MRSELFGVGKATQRVPLDPRCPAGERVMCPTAVQACGN